MRRAPTPVSDSRYSTTLVLSARGNMPTFALENLTIDRSAILRTMLRDGVSTSQGLCEPLLLMDSV
jgi:hypothetical protein